MKTTRTPAHMLDEGTTFRLFNSLCTVSHVERNKFGAIEVRFHKINLDGTLTACKMVVPRQFMYNVQH